MDAQETKHWELSALLPLVHDKLSQVLITTVEVCVVQKHSDAPFWGVHEIFSWMFLVILFLEQFGTTKLHALALRMVSRGSTTKCFRRLDERTGNKTLRISCSSATRARQTKPSIDNDSGNLYRTLRWTVLRSACNLQLKVSANFVSRTVRYNEAVGSGSENGFSWKYKMFSKV